MSTGPATWNLDFAASRRAAQKALGPTMELLHPMVEVGHEFLRDSAGVCRDHVDLAVATSFRQCLEFVDAVDVLLRHLVLVPAIAPARSAIETAAYTVHLAARRDAVLASAFLHAGVRHMERELLRKRDAPYQDDDGRREVQMMLDELDAHFREVATDYASRKGIAELRALRSGRPWYSIQDGPGSFHELLAQMGLADLARFYSDLNAAVHEGIPQLGFHGADGGPGDPTGREWLRPLRVYSPWAFRPVHAAGLAAKISLVTALRHLGVRLPGWGTRIQEFRERHNRRCREARMEGLSF
jgi:hypothetical protein